MLRRALAVWTFGVVFSGWALTGCGDEGGSPPSTLLPTIVWSHNVGTSEFLDFIEESPHRETCANYYGNDLCTVDTEAIVKTVINFYSPRFLALQEVSPPGRCTEPSRPPEANEAPFVCSVEGAQIERLVPSTHDYACSQAYPSNCVAWNRAIFDLECDEECTERDCSLCSVDVESGCGDPGRSTYVRLRDANNEWVLAGVHLAAGPDAAAEDCRTMQLEGLATALEAEDRKFIVAGDYNLDPKNESDPDAIRLVEMLSDLELKLNSTSGFTNLILENRLDHVAGPTGLLLDCRELFLEAEGIGRMMDHAAVRCIVERGS